MITSGKLPLIRVPPSKCMSHVRHTLDVKDNRHCLKCRECIILMADRMLKNDTRSVFKTKISKETILVFLFLTTHPE